MIPIKTCGFCGRQVLSDHDCPEKRAAQRQLDELGRVPTVTGIISETTTTNDRDQEAGDDNHAKR